MLGYIGSPSPNEGRQSHRFTAGQGNPSGASAALTRRSGGANALSHSLREATMCTAAACLIVAALTMPGTAQTEGLEQGFYVAEQYSCDSAPSVGVLSFDGKAFINKRLACTLAATANASGGFPARCVEAGDESTAETLTWRFKKLSATKFQIDGNTFRQCGKTP